VRSGIAGRANRVGSAVRLAEMLRGMHNQFAIVNEAVAHWLQKCVTNQAHISNYSIRALCGELVEIYCDGAD